MLGQNAAHLEIGGAHLLRELLGLGVLVPVQEVDGTTDLLVDSLVVCLGHSHHLVFVWRAAEVDIGLLELLFEAHGIAGKALHIRPNEGRLSLSGVHARLAEIDVVTWLHDS